MKVITYDLLKRLLAKEEPMTTEGGIPKLPKGETRGRSDMLLELIEYMHGKGPIYEAERADDWEKDSPAPLATDSPQMVNRS